MYARAYNALRVYTSLRTQRARARPQQDQQEMHRVAFLE